MPCYQTRTMTVELAAADKELLAAAMRDLGYTDYTYNAEKQRLTIWTTGRQREATADEVSEIKMAYSTQVVRKVARAKGWTLTQKTKQTQKASIR